MGATTIHYIRSFVIRNQIEPKRQYENNVVIAIMLAKNSMSTVIIIILSNFEVRLAPNGSFITSSNISFSASKKLQCNACTEYYSR